MPLPIVVTNEMINFQVPINNGPLRFREKWFLYNFLSIRYLVDEWSGFNSLSGKCGIYNKACN